MEGDGLVIDPSAYHSTWGAGEWIGLTMALAVLMGAVTTLIVQIHRMRRENTSQHAEGRALVTDVRDRLLDVHESIHHVDEKVDDVAKRLSDHEADHRGDRDIAWRIVD